MRDIRARIAQQHGIDLTEQQVQDLAARRLESILDVRTVNPALVQQIRDSASSGRVVSVPSQADAPPYQFEESTLYASNNGLIRTIRRLLNPILKLFFNPNPLIQALNTQARLNVEATRREAERDQRQAEWNALHYEILQRLVTEVARVSLEAQSLGLRVESLGAKVDFNERRVRGIEGSMHEPESRPAVAPAPQAARAQEVRAQEPREARAPEEKPAQSGSTETAATGEAPRRRRRRRRGRRGPGAGDASMAPGTPVADGTSQPLDESDAEGDEQDESLGVVTTEGEAIVTESVEPQQAPEPSNVPAPVSFGAPEPKPPAVEANAAPLPEWRQRFDAPVAPAVETSPEEPTRDAVRPAPETDHDER
jgi:hypothetical protein